MTSTESAFIPEKLVGRSRASPRANALAVSNRNENSIPWPNGNVKGDGHNAGVSSNTTLVIFADARFFSRYSTIFPCPWRVRLSQVKTSTSLNQPSDLNNLVAKLCASPSAVISVNSFSQACAMALASTDTGVVVCDTAVLVIGPSISEGE